MKLFVLLACVSLVSLGCRVVPTKKPRPGRSLQSGARPRPKLILSYVHLQTGPDPFFENAKEKALSRLKQMRLVFEVVGMRKHSKRVVRLDVFDGQLDAEVGLARLTKNPEYRDWLLSIRKNLALDLEPGPVKQNGKNYDLSNG